MSMNLKTNIVFSAVAIVAIVLLLGSSSVLGHQALAYYGHYGYGHYGYGHYGYGHYGHYGYGHYGHYGYGHYGHYH
jgi:hypothetical protein